MALASHSNLIYALLLFDTKISWCFGVKLGLSVTRYKYVWRDVRWRKMIQFKLVKSVAHVGLTI